MENPFHEIKEVLEKPVNYLKVELTEIKDDIDVLKAIHDMIPNLRNCIESAKALEPYLEKLVEAVKKRESD